MSARSIACVIPAYEREATLGRAIESALAQTRPPDEVLVVDDGSSDGSGEVARSFGAAVRCLRQENAGGAAARNRGAREARAEWIAFLDSDDWWRPGHLAAVEAAIEATGGRADYYFADMERPGPAGATLSQWREARFSIAGEHELRGDGTAWVLRPRVPMMLQSSVFHRGRFLAKGGLWEALRRRHDTHALLLHAHGRPICAVRHVGTVMTADGAGGRLTEQMGLASSRYHEYSVLLWSDLLRRMVELEPRRRALLQHRLARAHLGLARARAREGARAAALRALRRAGAARPASLLRAVLDRGADEWKLFPGL